MLGFFIVWAERLPRVMMVRSAQTRRQAQQAAADEARRRPGLGGRYRPPPAGAGTGGAWNWNWNLNCFSSLARKVLVLAM